jgi:antitoxin VapB
MIAIALYALTFYALLVVGEAVIQALRERLHREEARRRGPALRREIEAIRKRCASLPVLDGRSAEEILGYDDDRGLPR